MAHTIRRLVGHHMDPRRQVNDRTDTLQCVFCLILIRLIVQNHPLEVIGF